MIVVYVADVVGRVVHDSLAPAVVVGHLYPLGGGRKHRAAMPAIIVYALPSGELDPDFLSFGKLFDVVVHVHIIANWAAITIVILL